MNFNSTQTSASDGRILQKGPLETSTSGDPFSELASAFQVNRLPIRQESFEIHQLALYDSSNPETSNETAPGNPEEIAPDNPEEIAPDNPDETAPDNPEIVAPSNFSPVSEGARAIGKELAPTPPKRHRRPTVPGFFA